MCQTNFVRSVVGLLKKVWALLLPGRKNPQPEMGTSLEILPHQVATEEGALSPEKSVGVRTDTLDTEGKTQASVSGKNLFRCTVAPFDNAFGPDRSVSTFATSSCSPIETLKKFAVRIGVEPIHDGSLKDNVPGRAVAFVKTKGAKSIIIILTVELVRGDITTDGDHVFINEIKTTDVKPGVITELE